MICQFSTVTYGAEEGSRTLNPIGREILSLLHMPILPPRRIKYLSHWTFTNRSKGWVRICNCFQRSILSIILPTKRLSILPCFFMFHTFKRFSFWSPIYGIRTLPPPLNRAVCLHTTPSRLISALLASIVVQAIIETSLYNEGIFQMDLYSLSNHFVL